MCKILPSLVILSSAMFVQVMTVGEVFGTFYAIECTQSRQVFGGFGAFVLGEMFRRFEVCFHLIEIAARSVRDLFLPLQRSETTYRVRRFVLLRLILPMAAAVGRMSSHSDQKSTSLAAKYRKLQHARLLA
jgi:hypothetical protein